MIMTSHLNFYHPPRTIIVVRRRDEIKRAMTTVYTVCLGNRARVMRLFFRAEITNPLR